MYWGNPVNPTLLATAAQWAAEPTMIGVAMPDDAVAYLQACTTLVLDATGGAYYAVDATTGLATDSGVAAVLAKATVIQATAWLKMGIDPALGGAYLAAIKSSAKIGSASYSLADAAAGAEARQHATTNLVPAAARVLAQANLLGNGGPWTFG